MSLSYRLKKSIRILLFGQYKNAEGFPRYLKESQKLNMDINEYIEKKLGWGNSKEVFEKYIVGYLNNSAKVLEIGVGSGRFSRHIINHNPNNEIILVDHSEWIIRFLTDYFNVNKNSNIKVVLNDGQSLGFINNSYLDTVLSFGTFIELKFAQIYLYAKEFSRIMVDGGICIFDILDIENELVWEEVKTLHESLAKVFTYHRRSDIVKLFSFFNFELISYFKMNSHSFLIFKKQK